MKTLFVISSLIYLVLIISFTSAAPSADSFNEKDAIEYLKTYGYLPVTKSKKPFTERQLQHALKRLQTFGHIEVTGKIDEQTMKLIKTPRCGVADFSPAIFSANKRSKRFHLLSAKWEKHHILWHFDSKHGRFHYDSHRIRRIIGEAFKVWDKHSALTFQETSDIEEADILISFEPQYHPKADPYSMEGTILAHGFRPGPDLGGDIHIREDKVWDFDVSYTEEAKEGANSFFAVIVHEIGHALGLDHSDDIEAIMFFALTEPKPDLSDDDVRGIQHIYGIPKRYNEHSTTQANEFTDIDEPEIPDKCDTSYDAISRVHGELFVFKGRYMWRPESESDAIKIRVLWSALPENMTHVDAVYENDEGHILFFIGRDIYAFSGISFLHRSTLSHFGIDSNVQKVDAVFRWNYNGLSYIFSGDKYWRLEGHRVNQRYYPRDILASWKEVYDIDTAFSDDDKLYFFKGKYFFEFDPRTMRIDRMRPLPSAMSFMHCLGQKTIFKISTRLGDEANGDVIDEGKVVVFPDDEDNIEKLESAAKTKNTSDSSAHYLLFPILLASLAISRALPSISLYF